jgi:hypothetical protein
MLHGGVGVGLTRGVVVARGGVGVPVVFRPGVGEDEGRAVTVVVGVRVLLGVGVSEGSAVLVTVGVRVGVSVGVEVAVLVATGVRVRVRVASVVGLAAGVLMTGVSCAMAVGSILGVRVGLDVGVTVAVSVGVGVYASAPKDSTMGLPSRYWPLTPVVMEGQST